jgi:large subunit ribosomal protein L18
MKKLKKNKHFLKNKKRHLKKILGNLSKPRLSIYKSNKHIYSQLIDDINGHTLCSSSTTEKKKTKTLLVSKNENQLNLNFSYIIGQNLGKRAKNLNIQAVVFDRNYQLYHGKIKKLIEGLRGEGIIC